MTKELPIPRLRLKHKLSPRIAVKIKPTIVLVGLLLLLLLTQCQKPVNVLGRVEMAAITRDMLLTDAYLTQHPQPDSIQAYYYESIFKRYGITQAQYDSSLIWYGKNIHRLSQIYEDAQKQLQSEKELTDTLLIDSIDMQRIRFVPLQSQWQASSRLYLSPSRTHYLYDELVDLDALAIGQGSLLEWGAIAQHTGDTTGLQISLRLLIQDEMGHYFRSVMGQRFYPTDSLEASQLPAGDMRYYFTLPTDTLPPHPSARLFLFIQKPPHYPMHLHHIYLGVQRSLALPTDSLEVPEEDSDHEEIRSEIEELQPDEISQMQEPSEPEEQRLREE